VTVAAPANEIDPTRPTLIATGEDARRTTSCGRLNFSTSRRCMVAASDAPEHAVGAGCERLGGSSQPADRDAEGAELGGDGRDRVRAVRVDGPAGEMQAERAVAPGQRGGAGVAAERGGVVAEHPPAFV